MFEAEVWLPVLLQCINADLASLRDVGMKDFGQEEACEQAISKQNVQAACPWAALEDSQNRA